ncbi:MAG: hypothetical protein Q8R81_04515 [Novosphingobium sp.]|uniref:hypothetical protein n=1 Tax=Novosphingobium sp. TaxID=1874826 RepID=UPI002732F9FC|nr:hypothetical protein [Novosphingobium sp.]MDP3549640.1 hypothetical protein [Novosphingobium sp.]
MNRITARADPDPIVRDVHTWTVPVPMAHCSSNVSGGWARGAGSQGSEATAGWSKWRVARGRLPFRVWHDRVTI